MTPEDSGDARYVGMKEKGRIPRPIPPESVVQLAGYPPASRSWKKNLGAIFRVGYYSRTDGPDCIWLVNEDGEYQETLDHDYLARYFDVIQTSDETSLYGAKRPRIGAIIPASKRRSTRRVAARKKPR